MIQRTCKWLADQVAGELQGHVTAHALCFKGVSTDSRQISAGQLYVPLVGERFDGHDFVAQAIERGAAAVIWQREKPLPQKKEIPFILVDETLQALQQMATAYRKELGIPVVAITGSNGKTSLKDLVAAVLSGRYRVHKTKGNLNNHIGVPLTLLATPENTEIIVVEMGMNHAGEITQLSNIAQPNVAMITNIGESHLAFLSSREGIAQAKLEIGEGLAADGLWFVNGDEPLLRQKLAKEPRRVTYIGWEEQNDDVPLSFAQEGLKGISFISRKSGVSFHAPLLGRHNAIHALLAIAVGRHFDVPTETMQKQLAEVQITGGRLEIQQAKNGMQLINDAYNASPTSMKAALNLLCDLEPNKEKWVLLGDMLELGEQEKAFHEEIGERVASMDIQHIYTFGERGKWISTCAQEVNQEEQRVIRHFSSHEEAVAHLSKVGSESVLLLVKASQGAKLEKVVDQLIGGAITVP
jgi:UDP-N-acetylmuramoyl-tripeptide--D-alanyl-D-alanine ligase